MPRSRKPPAAPPAPSASTAASPLDFMLELMRDEGSTQAARLAAAKAAAPYVHPRLAAHVVAPPGSDSVEWLRGLARQGAGIDGLFGGEGEEAAE